MIGNKAKELAAQYERDLKDKGYELEEGDESTDLELPPDIGVYQALWMVIKMKEPEGKLEDPITWNRWLGFVQGVLYSKNIYTIKELRDQSRPLKEEF